ncbi:MAG: hypothetical protein IJU84_10190 [Clostridia bacterium]|nr:hypothetical protein [Clostridia bacterium]
MNTCNLPRFLPHCKQGSRGDFAKISVGKRSNRLERRKANTCNLSRFPPHCDEPQKNSGAAKNTLAAPP